jgi:protoporphyrinogen oxidase
MAAGLAFAEAGLADVTVIERGDRPGGLAGSFEHDGHSYPLGYHHVLHRDRALAWMLDRLGVLDALRWRRVSMLFQSGSRLYDLARPRDFCAFPLPVADKLAFVRLMAYALATRGWRRWQGRSARELVDRWGSVAVRETLFEPLCRLKFEADTSRVSAAWLGTRLAFREGSAALGYLPGDNWTRALTEGLAGQLVERGVRLRLGSGVRRLGGPLDGAKGRIAEVELDDGSRIEADLVVSALPSDVYLGLLGGADETPGLDSIRYTALISVVAGLAGRTLPDFYWLNLSDLDSAACAIFRLDALNPGIGPAGQITINFVTHLADRSRPLFRLSDDDLIAAYSADFRRAFGFEAELTWARFHRLSRYSPIFFPGYRNPPVRSSTWENVYFAGNYRNHPSIASTGTAIASGLEAAAAALASVGRSSPLQRQAARFRWRRRRRG